MYAKEVLYLKDAEGNIMYQKTKNIALESDVIETHKKLTYMCVCVFVNIYILLTSNRQTST